jgi:hypothetical protein
MDINPFTTARPAALFVESVLYGFNLISFYHAVRELSMREGKLKPIGEINKSMLAITILLAGFGTVNVSFFLNEIISILSSTSYYRGIGDDAVFWYPFTAFMVCAILYIVPLFFNR